MLASSSRLGREEVARVVRDGYRVSGRGLAARFLPDVGHPQARFALVVPAKQLPLAVARHQLKRRLRAAIRAWQSGSSPLRSMLVVVFADRLAATWDYQGLKTALAKLFHDLQRV